MAYTANDGYRENEESLVYYVITDPTDTIIDRFLGDTSNLSSDELSILKSAYIGAILLRPIKTYSVISEENLPPAFPINSNIRQYPLVNETVVTATFFGKLYYWPLNSLGNPHSGELLNLRKSFTPNPTKKGIASENNDSVSSGISNSDSEDKQAEKLGNYFERNNSIHALLPFEGDIIYEGRFGQSIRMGGYNTGETNNSFSDQSPQVLIRNSENNDSQTKAGIGEFIEEDINTDGSSIHMTSGDNISPFVLSTEVKKQSFTEYPENLDGDQIIINSDRVVVSAKAGEFIGVGKSAIGFLTDGIFSIDAKSDISMTTKEGELIANAQNMKFTIPDGGKIYLGEADNEEQRMVKGDALVEWLKKLMDELMDETHPTAVGPSGPPSNASKYRQLSRELDEVLSANNFTI